MKQLFFIGFTFLFLFGCNFPFQKETKCLNFVQSLSQRTKDWLAPTEVSAKDKIVFFNSAGDSVVVFLVVSNLTNTTPNTNSCPTEQEEKVINYLNTAYSPEGYLINMSIIGMEQNISIIPANNFCDINFLNTFNTQSETITNRNGILNYMIINDFEFKGEKVVTLNGQFSGFVETCSSDNHLNLSEFWISKEYGLMQFKDFKGIIWTLHI